jgi:hypothetical protein
MGDGAAGPGVEDHPMNDHITWQKDEASELLGTGYYRFHSTAGVHGLARIVGVADLHLLAVQAIAPGTGQFREFMKRCQTGFQNIWVWELWSEELPAILTRYGFVACETVERGEKLTGMRWTRS